MLNCEVMMRLQFILARPLHIALIMLIVTILELRLTDDSDEELILGTPSAFQNRNSLSSCQILTDDKVANWAFVIFTQPLLQAIEVEHMALIELARSCCASAHSIHIAELRLVWLRCCK